jgi:hypothetical protein
LILIIVLQRVLIPKKVIAENAEVAPLANLNHLAKDDGAQQPAVKKEEIPTAAEVTKCFLDINVPSAPVTSPYHLVYEAFAQEPWKVLIGSFLMTKVNTVTGKCMVLDFFKKFPSLKSINTLRVYEFFTVG